MYSQLLQNYENVKDDYSLLRKRYDDLVASHSAAVSKLEHSQVSYTLFWIMQDPTNYIVGCVIQRRKVFFIEIIIFPPSKFVKWLAEII